MNELGPYGCELQFEELAAKIKSNAKDLYPNTLIPDVVVRKLLRQAIDEARTDEKNDDILRIKSSNELRTIVWVYWAGGAEGDELKYSMRSASKILDRRELMICGSKPDWYKGYHIDSPRFQKHEAKAQFGTGAYSKWIDSIKKLQAIIDCQYVSDTFMWMYDDTFILKPCTTEWVERPMYRGTLPHHASRRKTWQQVRKRTYEALVSRDLPTYDYSTHMPLVFNKDRLQRTIDEFNLHNVARCVESIYMNHHYSEPEILTDHFAWYKRIPPFWTPCARAAIINVGGFKAPVERLMRVLYSKQASHEVR